MPDKIVRNHELAKKILQNIFGKQKAEELINKLKELYG